MLVYRKANEKQRKAQMQSTIKLIANDSPRRAASEILAKINRKEDPENSPQKVEKKEVPKCTRSSESAAVKLRFDIFFPCPYFLSREMETKVSELEKSRSGAKVALASARLSVKEAKRDAKAKSADAQGELL